MKINYVKGNLLEAESGVIAHGCNAQGVMGSGVAKAVREKYPLAYEKYKLRCDLVEHKQLLLGRVIWYEVNNQLHIANAITQLNFGSDGKQYVDYEAIQKSFTTINSCMFNDDTLHIPMIGAGLGGGDWEFISTIIETTVTNPKEIVCWVL